MEKYARTPFQFKWLYKELGLFPVGDMYRLDSSLTANVQPSDRNLHQCLTHPHRIIGALSANLIPMKTEPPKTALPTYITKEYCKVVIA
jgi:hypothetical protein